MEIEAALEDALGRIGAGKALEIVAGLPDRPEEKVGVAAHLHRIERREQAFLGDIGALGGKLRIGGIDTRVERFLRIRA